MKHKPVGWTREKFVEWGRAGGKAVTGAKKRRGDARHYAELARLSLVKRGIIKGAS